MEAKSPTASVKSREMIGVDQFSQRREVFGKHDTVFLPPHSPNTPTPTYREVDPIITSNHGKTTANFKRNTPGYSSMRETRTEENHFDFRPRKYSDNFTSDLNQSDDVDYRRSMTERTRRLSKLRRDFLASNLHDPSADSSFNRSGTRASLPAKSFTYKIESPTIYKFPFAEPYGTPQPVRRVLVDFGPVEVDGGKENKVPVANTRHLSLTSNETNSQVDHQKLFEELVKRYSPQRKPVDWQLPPTRPRVVGSVPKSITSNDSNENKKNIEETLTTLTDDDVFDNKEDSKKEQASEGTVSAQEELKLQIEIIQNGLENASSEDDNKEDNSKEENKERNSKVSLTELEEKNDRVPELSSIQRQISREINPIKRQQLETITDLTIPALLEKMNEGENQESKKGTKVKRKRSFLDKLLGRNKQK